MNNDDERDYEEEAANKQLLIEEADEKVFGQTSFHELAPPVRDGTLVVFFADDYEEFRFATMPKGWHWKRKCLVISQVGGRVEIPIRNIVKLEIVNNSEQYIQAQHYWEAMHG